MCEQQPYLFTAQYVKFSSSPPNVLWAHESSQNLDPFSRFFRAQATKASDIQTDTPRYGIIDRNSTHLMHSMRPNSLSNVT